MRENKPSQQHAGILPDAWRGCGLSAAQGTARMLRDIPENQTTVLSIPGGTGREQGWHHPATPLGSLLACHAAMECPQLQHALCRNCVFPSVRSAWEMCGNLIWKVLGVRVAGEEEGRKVFRELSGMFFHSHTTNIFSGS